MRLCYKRTKQVDVRWFQAVEKENKLAEKGLSRPMTCSRHVTTFLMIRSHDYVNQTTNDFFECNLKLNLPSEINTLLRTPNFHRE